jgi:hypothetical protein
MSNIVPAGSVGISRRSSRITGRTLARIDHQVEIGLAEIEGKAELQVAKLLATTFVGKKAMHEVAMVSQLEQQLAALVPSATSRLQALGDMLALDAAEIVSDTVRVMGR